MKTSSGTHFPSYQLLSQTVRFVEQKLVCTPNTIYYLIPLMQALWDEHLLHIVAISEMHRGFSFSQDHQFWSDRKLAAFSIMNVFAQFSLWNTISR